MGDLGPAELREMQGLAQRVTAARPDLLNGDATTGELAWVWGSGVDARRASWRHRFWRVDGVLAGWGWVHLPRTSGDPAELIWQTDPGRPELLDEILDWYDEAAAGVDRSVVVQSADTAARSRLPAHGYALDADAAADDGSWHQWNTRTLDDLPEPVLPPGFRFCSAADLTVAEVVGAHHAAWPTSKLTEQAMTRVQSTWPYRPDLHVFVQAPDGALAGSATAWFDPETGTAEFEPVGTHADYRRRGLGTALQLHGMRQVRAAGGRRMFVACLAGSAHPAARDLYLGVGFRPISHDLPQLKRV
jgi:GNAT superfamily N-acetyltransferase